MPIPVLSPQSAATATAATPLGNATNRDYKSSRQALPTISVTKAPLPRPVDLPTQDDIIVTVDSPLGEEDIEAARHIDVYEIDEPPSPIREIQSMPLQSTTTVAAAVPLPRSPIPRMLSTSPEPISTPPTKVSDLLENTEEVVLVEPATITTTVVEPVSVGVESSDVDAPVLVKPIEESPVLVSSEDVLEEETPDTTPSSTIRLIGGGGIAGLSEDTDVKVPLEDNDGEPELVEIELGPTPTTPVSISNPAVEAVKADGKNEKKKTGLSANLKRLSHLGNSKRKKDSAGSLKEVV